MPRHLLMRNRRDQDTPNRTGAPERRKKRTGAKAGKLGASPKYPLYPTRGRMCPTDHVATSISRHRAARTYRTPRHPLRRSAQGALPRTQIAPTPRDSPPTRTGPGPTRPPIDAAEHPLTRRRTCGGRGSMCPYVAMDERTSDEVPPQPATPDTTPEDAQTAKERGRNVEAIPTGRP